MKTPTAWKNMKYVEGKENKKLKVRQYRGNRKWFFQFAQSSHHFCIGREKDRKNSILVLPGSA